MLAMLSYKYARATAVSPMLCLPLVATTLVVVTSLGCGKQADETSTPPTPTSVKDPPTPTDVRSADVVVASWDETQLVVAQNKGKVVVLDIWSTSCIPCLREFPNLVQLQEKYADRVACVSFNLDYIGLPDEPPESYRKKVLAFLGKQQATFHNVISSETDVALYDKLKLSSIPAVLVYDRSGELRQRFDNDHAEYGDEGFTYQQHVIPLVEQLLNEG